MKIWLKGYIKFNRYAYRIYDCSRNMRGLPKYCFIVQEAIKAICRHGLLLNDYYKKIRRDGYKLKLNKYGLTFYLPYCEYDCIQRTIVRDEDFFSIQELKYLKEKYINPGDDIIDIGANIGNHTLYFIKECHVNSVYSFEPQKDIFSILKKNIMYNHASERCRLYNVALGNSKGKGNMASNRYNTGGACLITNDTGNVDVCRLDDFTFDNVDFIKIDVEGYEYNVLAGAKKTINTHKPLIYVEIFEKNFDKVNNLLFQMGYSCIERITGEDYIFGYNNSR